MTDQAPRVYTLDDWYEHPTFDFLDPYPFSQVTPYLLYAFCAALTGVFFAYLNDAGFVLLRRPAQVTWTASLLILLYAGALGLSRFAKWFILFLTGIICVPGLIIAGSVYVYTRQGATKEVQGVKADKAKGDRARGDIGGGADAEGVRGVVGGDVGWARYVNQKEPEGKEVPTVGEIRL